jgi:hypothetical protein
MQACFSFISRRAPQCYLHDLLSGKKYPETKKIAAAGYREVEPTPDLALNDYKITVLRPGDRPKALATISKCLKPA